MTYQVLARKWRPQEFGSLIGQEPIVTALRNALTEGRIGQAYIFSGIRGVGKTTAARLLAKALNCENGPAADPCNDCAVCREITAGSDLDVLEVDAATYSKVEQVRDLTESLRYAPARDRFKVVVIDEIHRLSRQAFDALLKIIEEPPRHLVFIFATTEIEAVPATILSRCQEYHFRRVALAEIVSHLRHLCGEEEIEASESALRWIARAGDGSVRDALALLDQLATFGRGVIAEEDAARLVGGLDLDRFARLLAAILRSETAVVAATVREIEDRGLDPRQVYGHFLAFCRDALHLSVGGDVELPGETGKELADLAREAGYENLLRLLHHLLSSESAVRRSESAGLAVEIAWLRAAELPRLVRVEALLRGETPIASQASPRTTPKSEQPTARPAPPPERASRPERLSPTPPDPEPPSPSARRDSDPLAAILETISRRKQPLAAHLREARSLEIVGNRLLVSTEPGDDWLARALQRSGNREVLAQSLVEILGEGASWERREASTTTTADPSAESSSDPPDDPTVQAVLDIFGGQVEAVEPNDESRES